MTHSKKIKPWKVLSSKIIHSTPWIEIIEDRCLVNGKEFTYTYTHRIDEGPLIIAEDKDKSLWMVKQYRHPIKKIIWQFPVEGKIKNETWKDAAIRGLEEELQLKADAWQDLGQFYTDPGGLQQEFRVYIARDLKHIKNPNLSHLENEIEELGVAKFSRKEIEEMISSGEIRDNWTLSALFLYDRMNQ